MACAEILRNLEEIPSGPLDFFTSRFCRSLVMYSVLSGGSRGGARAPLFWVKKEEMTEGRNPGWASKIYRTGSLFSSKSGSAASAYWIKAKT